MPRCVTAQTSAQTKASGFKTALQSFGRALAQSATSQNLTAKRFLVSPLTSFKLIPMNKDRKDKLERGAKDFAERFEWVMRDLAKDDGRLSPPEGSMKNE